MTKISLLPAIAAEDIDGTEAVPAVKGGETGRVALAAILQPVVDQLVQFAAVAGHVYATRAEANGDELADGEWALILADEDYGGFRTLNRVEGGEVVFYEQLPSAQATVATIGRLTAMKVPGDVSTVMVEGYHARGVGGAPWHETATEGETPWRKQSADGRWWMIDAGYVTPACLGARPDDEDHYPILQAMIACMEAHDWVQTIRFEDPGFELLVSEQITFQDKFPAQPIRITGNARIRATAKTTNGTIWLFRNSHVHADCPQMICDGGGAQGILGNNGWSGSGLATNGANRTVITGNLGTAINCRVDPFLRGGKGLAFQNGVDHIDVVIKSINCDGGASHEPDFGTPEGYLTQATYRVTAINCRDYAFWGLCGNGPNFDPSKEDFSLDLRAYNCAGEGPGLAWSAGDVDTDEDTITIPDHGYFTRHSVLVDGDSLPSGLSIGEYAVGRLDKDTILLAPGVSSCVNVPPTNIATDASGRIAKTGHNFFAGDTVVYICPTGWTEPDPDNPGNQRALSVADSTPLAELSHGARYKAVRLSHNFFALAASSATILTFISSAVNTTTGEITIEGHGLSTGDAVRISIGANVTAIMDFPQLQFKLQADTIFTPGAAVNVGSTEASQNDQYKPDTVYYVRAIDTDTVALYRTSDDAAADTNRIEIASAGSSTMGLALQSDIIAFSAQPTGWQSFVKPVALGTAAGGTLYRGGTAPLVFDRSGYGTIRMSGYNDASRGATDFVRGRMSFCQFDIRYNAAIAGRLWESRPMGSWGEVGQPGATKSVGNTFNILATANGRELASVTGTASSGSPVITIIPTADLLRIEVGDMVTVSANFPSTSAEYEVIAKTTTSLTLDTNATGNGSVTITLVNRWNKGVLSRANPGLIGGGSTNGVQPLGCTVRGSIAGYPTGVALFYNTNTGCEIDLFRVETGGRLIANSDSIATIGTSANQFSATRRFQIHALSTAIANVLFNDDGSTAAQIRTVASRTLDLQDAGGNGVFRISTAGGGALSSSWNQRPLLIGSHRLWFDTGGLLRTKSSAPSSETDGTVVGTQS